MRAEIPLALSDTLSAFQLARVGTGLPTAGSHLLTDEGGRVGLGEGLSLSGRREWGATPSSFDRCEHHAGWAVDRHARALVVTV